MDKGYLNFRTEYAIFSSSDAKKCIFYDLRDEIIAIFMTKNDLYINLFILYHFKRDRFFAPDNVIHVSTLLHINDVALCTMSGKTAVKCI